MQEQKDKTKKQSNSTMTDVIARISNSENILIALSKNPTADELAAAIGLSLFLDKVGKHAVAIYSGETPNILDFLDPEQRLDTNTDSLQDFIIAINKEKADHLRYKVEGDYVRVYITPYKTKISAEDLEFSHGDFNIGLVIALNVPNESSLDAALTSHGRILHDAEIINIAATASDGFGQTQWLDPSFSSISEMIANLVFAMEDELGDKLDDEVATAFLTGIFIATDRFSNGRTQPETMNMAAKLMSAGANQQQISAHLALESDGNVALENNVGLESVDNGFVTENSDSESTLDFQPVSDEADLAQAKEKVLADSHEKTEETVNNIKINSKPVLKPELKNESIVLQTEKPVSDLSQKINIPNNVELPPVVETANDNQLNLAITPSDEAPTPNLVNSESNNNEQGSVQGMPIISHSVETFPKSNGVTDSGAVDASASASSISPVPGGEDLTLDSESGTEVLGKDYGALMDEAIKADEPQMPQKEFVGGNPALMAAPGVADSPEENHIPGMDFNAPVEMSNENNMNETTQDSGSGLGRDYSTVDASQPLAPSQITSNAPHLAPLPHQEDNVSVNNASAVPAESQSDMLSQNTVKMPMPGDEILPPPPIPPVDFGSVQSMPSVNDPVLPSVDENLMNSSVVVQPNSLSEQQMQSQAQSAPQPQSQSFVPVNNDPGAFRIPGM